MFEKQCIICGKNFEPKNNRQITCSKECGTERKKQTDKKKVRKSCQCIICGEVFKGNKGNKYCSSKCRGIGIKQEKKSTTKKCVVCCGDFKTEDNRQKYCSRRCFYINRQENPVYENVCLICSESFKTNNKKQKYCSVQCVGKANRINPVNHTCEHCGKNFHRTISKKDSCRFCSVECGQSYRQQNTGRYCEVCGKELQSNQYNYCCEKCEIVYRTQECSSCGKRFVKKHMQEKYCSDICKERTQRQKHQEYIESEEYKKYLKKRREERKESFVPKEYICKFCGDVFVGEYGGSKTYCNERCARRMNRLNRKMRIKTNGEIDDDISLEKLYKKEKGICNICGTKTDYTDYQEESGNFIAGNNYPSIDHIIPVSAGGSHTWDNIQLAHRYCNSLKSDNIYKGIEISEQLRLV